MILERVDAAPNARYRKAAKSGRYNGSDRIRSLRLLRLVTYMSVAAMMVVIVRMVLA